MDEWEEKYVPSSNSSTSDTEGDTDEASTKREYAEQPSPDVSDWPSQIKTSEDGENEKPLWDVCEGLPQTGQTLKRSHSPSDLNIDRPFKRQAGPLNLDYVDILNETIHDAASRVYVEDAASFEPTQIGATHWSSLEKAKLYSALPIVGKFNMPALAACISTKSVLEVQVYLEFVRHAAKVRHENDKRSILPQTDYPAAAELSQSCCYELEKAADSLAISQQLVEEKKEHQKWKSCWNISPAIAEHLERKATDATSQPLDPQFATLFHVSNWLELSCRVFMNSSVPSSNWCFVDDKPPSIWATALEDFYSLAVSMTKRLVHASLQASDSRRADNKWQCRPHAIEREDVNAALELLGLSRDWKESWRTCPRRLRLNISEELRKQDHSDEDDFLAYDEVENLLSGSLDIRGAPGTVSQDIEVRHSVSHQENPTASDDGNTALHQEEYDTDQEIRDILIQTRSARIRGRHDYKGALVNRVVAERRQAAYTDDFDTIKSQQVEARLWAIMGKEPPVSLSRRNDVLGRAPRSSWKLDELYRTATDWTTGLYHSDE